jgi:hypothetical protein
MTRATIAKLWLIGFFVPILGLVLLLEGLANSSGALALMGWFVTIAGALAQLCAWILALGYAARRAQWAWFAALLVLGLAGLEIAVMIVFLLATPRDELAGHRVPVRA